MPLYLSYECSIISHSHILATAATFRGLQTFAGPLGQQSIFGCPTGSATDFVRPEAAYDLLLAMART